MHAEDIWSEIKRKKNKFGSYIRLPCHTANLMSFTMIDIKQT